MFRLDTIELEVLADEEARRLYEVEFSHHNPYTREIETSGIPYPQEEEFCQLVEQELLRKGEKIHRNGRYFKIARDQRK